ncbi:hypothetical protein RI129_005320 [Pyrocoelia pectoralis]|uniref:MalT-like TPR region domain-containing protein n=1 Tax=Pyrocoelia pectoralis TaxID=417401 RepID=A0AAN7VJY4_9COLE
MSRPISKLFRLLHKNFKFWRSQQKSTLKVSIIPFKLPPQNANPCYYLSYELLPCIALLSNIESVITPTDVEENITHLITLARMALEKGDAERAEAILLMGLKISDDNKVFLGMPYMYDILASIALVQGDIEKAEGLLSNAIEKMTQIGLPEDNHHAINFKLRLARIYSAFRDNDWAEIGFKTCLEAQKQKIINGDTTTRTGMLYVNVLFWYGVHMIRNQQYVEAKKMLDTAYQYSTKIKGLSPYQELVILYTLSDLNSVLGYLEVALEHMLNAVLLGKGISSLDLPRCYIKLARIYYKMGAYEQAKESALEAQKLALLFDYVDIVQEVEFFLEELARRGT